MAACTSLAKSGSGNGAYPSFSSYAFAKVMHSLILRPGPRGVLITATGRSSCSTITSTPSWTLASTAWMSRARSPSVIRTVTIFLNHSALRPSPLKHLPHTVRLAFADDELLPVAQREHPAEAAERGHLAHVIH